MMKTNKNKIENIKDNGTTVEAETIKYGCAKPYDNCNYSGPITETEKEACAKLEEKLKKRKKKDG